MYNWITDDLAPHDPAHLSTVQLPLEYDWLDTCPRFDAWLAEVAPGEVGKAVWAVLGYMLLTGNPLQRSVLLFGPARTGKSTLLRVLEKMLGTDNHSARSLRELATDKFAAADLFGKVANIRSDIESAYMEDTALFKQLTGGDTMTGERKFRDAFTFRPFAVPIFSANEIWRTGDNSEGYFRRWVILPFTHQVDAVTPFDESVLYAEASGIFNKAMEALRVLYATREFPSAGAVGEAMAEFRRQSDLVQMWLDDDAAVTFDRGHEGLKVLRTTAYNRYQEWTAANGSKPLSATNLYKSLEAKGLKVTRTAEGRFILGLSISNAMVRVA